MLTILAVLVVLICIGIAVGTTIHSVNLTRMNAALRAERGVFSERLDVLGNLMAPRTGTRPEAKLILARNYLVGLRKWGGV